jgi:hypothetical protein
VPTVPRTVRHALVLSAYMGDARVSGVVSATTVRHALVLHIQGLLMLGHALAEFCIYIGARVKKKGSVWQADACA